MTVLGSKARSQEQTSGFERLLRDFVGGLVEPSRIGFAAMVASFLLTAAGTATFLSEPVLSGPLGKYLARSPLDPEGHATYRALQLRAHPPETPQLIVLGSSAVESAIASEVALERALEARTGEDWSATLLTTPLQSPLDQLTLLDVALGSQDRTRKPVVVAIELSLSRERGSVGGLLSLEEKGRLGLRSAWADDMVRELGGKPRRRTGVYFLDNYNFSVLNGSKALMRLAIQQPATRRWGHFTPPKPLPPSQRRRAQIVSTIRKASAQTPFVYPVMDRLLQRLQRYPNVRVVFIESRLSPDLTQEAGLTGLTNRARERGQALASRHGASYWPIFAEAHLPASAYYDDLHIGSAHDQARVRTLLAQHVAELVHGGTTS